MSRVTEQKQKIDDIKTTQYITGALRDISAIELKGLRKKYNINDVFYTELRELFQLVWKIASEEKSNTNLMQGKGELYVAYTTNRHFYGSLNNDIMKKFTEHIDKNSHCLIIGNSGNQIWNTKKSTCKHVEFLSFEDDSPSEEEFNDLLKKVDVYQNVYVFYPGFTSVFKQDVKMVDITYKPSRHAMEKEEYKNLPEYLFEPDLSEMVLFFNTQVRSALLERLFLETQIARVAARLVKMDTADENANKLITSERRVLRRVRTSFSSRRMLETVVGYIQWHNKQTQHIGQ